MMMIVGSIFLKQKVNWYDSIKTDDTGKVVFKIEMNIYFTWKTYNPRYGYWRWHFSYCIYRCRMEMLNDEVSFNSIPNVALQMYFRKMRKSWKSSVIIPFHIKPNDPKFKAFSEKLPDYKATGIAHPWGNTRNRPMAVLARFESQSLSIGDPMELI